MQSLNMALFQGEEETAFVVEDVRDIIKESIEATIGGNSYQQSRVNQWSSSVVEQCLSQLMHCVIMQKTGAGLQTAASCFWDNTTDGSCPVTWENESMFCIVTVFGLAI
ncbi:dynein light chain Tctex-type 1 isoform X2 [Salarias fasciatus]|uniref:dynein light chain Tctex-type 1 isoform X2 n=1 Tax=Salarias fasciatus TaxID=181472 RepID=UPI001176A464|nr:dynein light chain Tctex-type 1 isoform X2 [Salarias fasciatus]